MADTTHNLKIKATLDASGIQSELDRLNQMDRAGRQGGQGSTAGTTRILTKLDQTLNRLNRTLESMSRGFQNPSGHGASPGNYQAPPVALSPETFRHAGGPALGGWAGMRKTTRPLPDRIIRGALSDLTEQEWLGSLLQGVSPRTLNRSERRRLSRMLGLQVPAPSIG